MNLLDIQNLRHAFGGVVALDGVSFAVPQGQIKAVIGPNGAGKTTLFNMVSGVLSPQQGTVLFDGQPITGMRPYQVARRGISRTFQNLCLFSNMTVLENVMIGCHGRGRAGLFSALLHLPRLRREEIWIRETAMQHLEAFGLAAKADVPVTALSVGGRRMVELARALVTKPRLLLLDEPASGLNPRETDDLARMIRGFRDQGITVLLVEHDMSLVMDIADDIFVLNFGKPVTEGPPAAIRANPQVVAIYLGGDFDHAAR